jgi:hypothetical protein
LFFFRGLIAGTFNPNSVARWWLDCVRRLAYIPSPNSPDELGSDLLPVCRRGIIPRLQLVGPGCRLAASCGHQRRPRLLCALPDLSRNVVPGRQCLDGYLEHTGDLPEGSWARRMPSCLNRPKGCRSEPDGPSKFGLTVGFAHAGFSYSLADSRHSFIFLIYLFPLIIIASSSVLLLGNY